MSVPKQAHLPGLVDGELQPLHRQRVFGPQVDEALLRADGVGADGHALDEAVRVALQHRPVHEGPGVALVGVAEDVLHVRFGLAGELPLEPGGEAGAAAATKAAAEHLTHHLLGGHIGQHLGQRLVALSGDVFLDLERVDDARVPQDDLDLPVEELDVAHLGHRLVRARRVAHQTVDYPPLEQVLFHDLADVFDLDVLIEDPVGVDQDYRSHCARSQTAGLDDPVLPGKALAFELSGKGGADLQCP